jgi:hypothetical protein
MRKEAMSVLSALGISADMSTRIGSLSPHCRMDSVYWLREEHRAMDDSPLPPRQSLTRTQRWLVTLIAVFGVWFVASAALVIVGKVGGSAALQYVLGAIVVFLIPVMLVLLFVILWPTLRGGRTDDEQAVLDLIMRRFAAVERPAALALLDEYSLAVPEAERARVQRALLTLSDGDLARLRYFTEETQQDYHDILDWAAEGATPDAAADAVARDRDPAAARSPLRDGAVPD